MKTLKLLLTVFVIALSYGVSMGMPDGNQSPVQSEKPRTGGKAILRHANRSTKRPNTPSRLSIECTYGERFIQFQIPNDAQNLVVRVFNDEEELEGMVSLVETTFETPLLWGVYNVECTDDLGRMFYGSIEY